ncbi:MAG: PQQ-binding-like beta-propeller repeat protein, partial [Gemmataceae bacterium]
MRTLVRPALLVVGLLVLAAGPLPAVIKVLTPLKRVLDGETFILRTEVQSVDAEKPSLVLKFQEHLKGKTEFEQFAINLTGDNYAKKDDHTKVMTERLVVGQSVILFISKPGANYSGFGYFEGTWFQMKGVPDADGKTVRWAFLHCEPYFRRTFKGTSAELKTTIVDYFEKKQEPAGPDEKEPPGYGPKPEKKCGSPATTGGLFGVIPSVVLVGPLALLAAFFPGVFAKLAVQLVRWRAFLTIASITSTLALVYFWCREYLPDAIWAAPRSFAMLLTLICLLGCLWAGLRYRRFGQQDPTLTEPPSLREWLQLALLAALLLFIVGLMGWFVGSSALLQQPWREFTMIALALTAATVYQGYRGLTRSIDGIATGVHLSLSAEFVALLSLMVGSILAWWPPATPSIPTISIETPIRDVPIEVSLWPIPEIDQPLSGITLHEGILYVGGMKQNGFRTAGRVTALDATNGALRWQFDHNGELKPVYSRPLVVGEQLHFGEGLHTDTECQHFIVDRLTGRPVKTLATTSHTEGGAAAAGGMVYFAAGDDGAYAWNLAQQKAQWHFPGQSQKLHIDTPPVLDDRHVYLGSGYYTNMLLALDRATGQPVWRTPVPLRSFGAAARQESTLYFGLGTGSLMEELSREPEPGVPPEKTPAGMIVAVDSAKGTI